jgi:hypothetical protein
MTRGEKLIINIDPDENFEAKVGGDKVMEEI